jgi:hypothetical protein
VSLIIAVALAARPAMKKLKSPRSGRASGAVGAGPQAATGR